VSDRRYVADDRVFYVVKRRAKEMIPSWEKGNPILWFSWEQRGSERDYLATGVKTLWEAEKPINKICGITG
jgi:hypothetical protein